eukprot:Nk52_evm5s269 gene=Nk52_evmTU5s269
MFGAVGVFRRWISTRGGMGGLGGSQNGAGRGEIEKNLRIGTSASVDRQFTEAEILSFAALSGDYNPLHTDAEAARSSRFKQRIVHGALINSVISGVIACHLTGPGTIYLRQTVSFPNPLFFGENMRARVTLKSASLHSPEAVCDLCCFVPAAGNGSEGKVVLEGEAYVGLSRKALRSVRAGMSAKQG